MKATPVPEVLALVAEDHALDVDRGAQVVGDALGAAVHLRAVVVPALEDGDDGQMQLFHGIGRELLPGAISGRPP